jgi:type IV pilus assembly protein PilV
MWRELNMQRYKQISSKQSGFALLEVVIAMFVLAIGILGAGALQTVGMQTTQGAYYRSQAMFIAADAVNRMRANRASASSYAGVDTQTSSGSTTCMSAAAGCSASALVAADIQQWVALVKNSQSLPGARGTITSPATNQYVITVNWNENEWQGGSTSARIADTKSYVLNIALDNH